MRKQKNRRNHGNEMTITLHNILFHSNCKLQQKKCSGPTLKIPLKVHGVAIAKKRRKMRKTNPTSKASIQCCLQSVTRVEGGVVREAGGSYSDTIQRTNSLFPTSLFHSTTSHTQPHPATFMTHHFPFCLFQNKRVTITTESRWRTGLWGVFVCPVG